QPTRAEHRVRVRRLQYVARRRLASGGVLDVRGEPDGGPAHDVSVGLHVRPSVSPRRKPRCSASTRAASSPPVQRADTTATPRPPVRATALTTAREIPPIATTGSGIACTSFRSRSSPSTGAGTSLVRVGNTGPSPT